MTECSAENCDRKSIVKGFCRLHYTRFMGYNKIPLNAPKQSGKGIMKLCKNCGKSIYVIPYRKKHNEGKYCSLVCSGKAKRNIKISEEHKRKISITHLGEKNCMWKGEFAGLNTLHDWVRRHKQKSLLCEHCGKEKLLDAANINHSYRRIIEDYLWLCRSCHMKHDYKNGYRKPRRRGNAN